MAKKKRLTVVDQSQGFVMTEDGLMIPGKFLRQMGEKVSIAFSPRLIVISAYPLRRSPQRRKSSKTSR